jgi:hypothetical protein
MDGEDGMEIDIAECMFMLHTPHEWINIISITYASLVLITKLHDALVRIHWHEINIK